MRHNLLIVDDEELIRQGLRARLEYLKIDTYEIFEAANGKAALEAAENHPIDIVITDIRMPDMDGLTLIHEIKKLQKDMQFVVLSGYAEFSYAETAIRLGVKAYLLKPLSNEELKKTFNKLYQDMERDSKIRSAMWRQSRMDREKQEYLQEKAINALLFDTSAETMDYKVLSEVCGIDAGDCDRDVFMMLSVIHISGETYDNMKFRRMDCDLIRFSVRNVLLELESCCGKQIVNSLSDNNQLYAIFFMEDERKLRNEVERIFLEMRSVLEKRMNIYLTLGVSRYTLLLGRKSASEALGALKQRIIYGDSNLYFYEDTGIFSEQKFPVSQIHLLDSYLEKNEIHKIKNLLQEIFSEELMRKYGTPYLRIMWVRILNVILKHYDKKRKASSMEKLLMSFNLPDQIQSASEIQQRITDIIMECVRAEAVNDMNARSKIQMAVRYIQEHYSEDIAINDLAMSYGMSPNYFSSIFKAETSQSAVNYITELKVKKAQELLENSELSVVDIAKRTGYEDSQYFFRVFKKHTGMTPLGYREQNRM
ncbi:response regulator [Lacrimispora sp.]|uniref:response regulator n=1 Tax=Lacrimispora sp. TaxID=2719234 RepID=UPI0028637B1F|nr:response regulator [Lacrimispora sp.]MDR7812409.1 response regulator [Lacrimispora sp.]